MKRKINVKDVWNWLKKYATTIAVLQAILWPIGYVYYSFEEDWHVMMSYHDVTVYTVLREWHQNNDVGFYRSKEECDAFIADDTTRFLYGDIPLACDEIKTEGEQIKYALDLYDYKPSKEEFEFIILELYGIEQDAIPESVIKLQENI